MKVTGKLFLLLLPLLILTALFFILDPFRIVYSYDDYSDNLIVMPDRDYISSQVYIKNRDKYKYDSFIIGSSATVAYKAKSWKTHLPATASPFVFDAAGETISGIHSKIAYLDKSGAAINNCLLIMDTEWTFGRESNQQSHLFIKHPAIAGTSWFNFYWVFAKDYFDFKFLKTYFRFLITRNYLPSMERYLVYGRFKYDTVTNDPYLVIEDSLVNENPAKYYNDRKNIFYTRDSVIPEAKPLISQRHVVMLNEMKAVFDKHHTDFNIIISPFYNQVELNNNDLLTLQLIFGKERVFNFSGKNGFTAVKENYYEAQHCRPIVGDAIFRIIYNNE